MHVLHTKALVSVIHICVHTSNCRVLQFHFLGGGKGVKAGYMSVHCSGYDPTKKRPDDLVAGDSPSRGMHNIIRVSSKGI
jgi:hypothetical protein